MGFLEKVRNSLAEREDLGRDLPVNLCSRIMLMKSSNDARRVWLVSFANKKLGEDMEEKS